MKTKILSFFLAFLMIITLPVLTLAVFSENDTLTSENSENETSDNPIENGSSIDELMGTADTNAMFDFEIQTPKSFVPGEAFDIVISLNTNVPLTDVRGIFRYNPDELTLNNTIIKNVQVPCFEGYKEWEDLTIFELDDDKNIIPGSIKLFAGSMGGEHGYTFSPVSEYGIIKFTLNFTAKEGVEETMLWMPHDSVSGNYFDDFYFESTDYTGIGDYVVINFSDDNNPIKSDDATIEKPDDESGVESATESEESIVEPEDPIFEQILGDVDNDGEITADDYITLKRIFFGQAKLEVFGAIDNSIYRCDINKSGNIDADDYILLKRVYFGTYNI